MHPTPHPPAQLGVVLGYDITYCAWGRVPDMGRAGYMQRRGTV